MPIMHPRSNIRLINIPLTVKIAHIRLQARKKDVDIPGHKPVKPWRIRKLHRQFHLQPDIELRIRADFHK